VVCDITEKRSVAGLPAEVSFLQSLFDVFKALLLAIQALQPRLNDKPETLRWDRFSGREPGRAAIFLVLPSVRLQANRARDRQQNRQQSLHDRVERACRDGVGFVCPISRASLET